MFKKLGRGWVAVLCSIALLGAGAVLVPPAASALGGINWSKAWKHEIKPRADKRYYTKAKAKKQFAPYPKVIRGTYDAVGEVSAANQNISTSFSFGVTLKSAPIVHYIPKGGAVPAGCSGTAAAPNADPGNLCVFESQDVRVSTRLIYNGLGSFGLSSPFGANVEITSSAAGQVYVYGTWAVRPMGLSKNRVPRTATHTSGARAGR